jgi:hemerythrin-like metal-binding protein
MIKVISIGDIMIIQWDEGLTVNNPVLDEQHRQFIKIINELDDLSSGNGEIGKKVLAAVDFLEQYAQKHFAYEESYFIEHNFPEAKEHQEYHNIFIQTIMHMRRQLDMNGVTVELANDISKFTADWLMMHIRGVDHRYQVFIDTGKLPPRQEHHHFVNKWKR